ncbi:hypothetical protein QAD02_006987 [Eretmocerus hayati]|uniref:Uncharacterized protein n=1 Tax=Eretmocerus hayati TaxID=131215 RepID=A0ACC2N6S5_9HYME|nr:hypothetical protein QAD02_006987 [Eretmocerus hayati]
MDSSDREMLAQLADTVAWSCESDYSEDDLSTEEICGSTEHTQMRRSPSIVSRTWQIPIMTEIVKTDHRLENRSSKLRLSARGCPTLNYFDGAQLEQNNCTKEKIQLLNFQQDRTDQSTHEFMWQNGIYHHLYNVQKIHDPTCAKKVEIDDRVKQSERN